MVRFGVWVLGLWVILRIELLICVWVRLFVIGWLRFELGFDLFWRVIGFSFWGRGVRRVSGIIFGIG